MGGRGKDSTRGAGAGKPNDATEYYVSGDGMWINQYLRGRGDFGELTESEKQYLSDLDKATNGKIKTETLYRNVDAEAVFGNMSDGDYEDLYSYLRYGADTFGKGAYADNLKRKLQGLLHRTEGKTITEKGFMSTTTDPTVAENWGDFTGSVKPIVMKIKTNTGTKGVNLSDYDRNVSADEAQHEILLARGQAYTVNKIYIRNGQIYVDVKMR